nr:MAG TPA: hypothetical protein [Caudoviricetes sp.]
MARWRGRGGYCGVLDGELACLVGVAQMVAIFPRDGGAEHLAITLAILADLQDLAQIQVLRLALRVPCALNIVALDLYAVLALDGLNKAVIVNGVDGELDGMVGSGINVHGMLQTVAVMMICHRAIYCGLIWSSPTIGGYPIRRVPLTLCPACTIYRNAISNSVIACKCFTQVCYGSGYANVVLDKLANVHHRCSTTIVVLT